MARPTLVRAGTAAETRLVGQALGPLLRELGPALPWTGEGPRPESECKIGLVIIPSRVINAAASAGTRAPCRYFSLGITEGALNRLPLDMLRAILAHELGHIHLGHLQARQARQRDGAPTETAGAEVVTVFSRAFDRRQEADADRFAVELLRKVEHRHPRACIALVYVFALLAEQDRGGARWLATHPSPDRRAETALAGCNG